MSDQLSREEILNAGPDDGDWVDVLRRTKRARRRRGIYGAVLLTALVVVGVASAYALGHPIVDFNTAEKGPTKVVNDFGELEVSAPENMTPGLLPDQARKIPGLYLDGKPYAFYVAPTKSGGFCSTIGGCVGVNDRPEMKDRVLGGLETSKSFERLDGVFIEKNADRLVLSYADGTSDDVPFIWVTEPIEAGFFVLAIPEAHQTSANRPTSLALYASGGERLANESLRDPRAMAETIMREMVNRSLPGYPHLSVPAEAIWSERKQLFDLRADDGARIGLWVAPKRGGGTCVWGTNWSQCNDQSQIEDGSALGFSLGNGGSSHIIVTGTFRANVARVEARFQDGDRIELVPKGGYLIWPIPSRHYPPGHRLEEAVGFDASGEVIASWPFTTQRGLYPCEKPRDYGYGVTMCP
jgi:hypothetical protein